MAIYQVNTIRGKYNLRFRFIFMLIWISILSFSQSLNNINISIIDYKTKDPIPFSTIHLFHNQNIGWVSNLQGIVQIKNDQFTDIKNDTLIVKSLGYFQKVMDFKQLEKDNYKVHLKAQEFKLSEVIIKPSEDLAIKLIKKNDSKSKTKFTCFNKLF